MALEAEIERLRKDTSAWRGVSRSLLGSVDDGVLTDWELDFLESLSSRTWLEELSFRQAEILLSVRDDTVKVSAYRGFSIKRLVQICYENRLDLEDEDQAWTVALYQSGADAVRVKEARKLLRIAKQVGEIESY